MAQRSGDELCVGDHVEARIDLPGVPAGTRGRVILVNGFDWIRYRVWFGTDATNGTDVGSLERGDLHRVDRKGNSVRGAA